MQLAYAPSMSKEKYTGPRVQRRLHWLKVLVAEGGGPTSVGAAVGTPPSHISAMTAGRRGVGDALADSLESAFGRPNGWMDRPIPETDAPLADTPSQVSRPTLAQALEVVLDAMAQSTAKAELKQLLPMLVETNAAAYRARLGELLGQSLQKQPSIADKLLAIPSEVESPRLSQRATEK